LFTNDVLPRKLNIKGYKNMSRGGRNKKTVEEQILKETYRRVRHGELTEKQKKYWYKNETVNGKTLKNKSKNEPDNLYSDIIKSFSDYLHKTNHDGFIINMNQNETDKTLLLLQKKYPDTDLNTDLIREVIKNEYNRKLMLSDKLQKQEYIEMLKKIIPKNNLL
jgi:hypothetical protein